MEKYLFLTDLHWGYERRGGHKTSLHDPKALKVALDFAADFKPHHIILGGDMLDCGCISHHNHGKPGATEGLKLLADAMELRTAVIEPVEKMGAKTLTYIEGNHEDWLNDLVDQIPSLEGIVGLKATLKLNEKWKIVPNGQAHKLGKLVFVHGDQIKGGENCAKWATVAYEKNVLFGHFHTHQEFSKTSAVEVHGHTGVAVPCLCRKGPKYGGGSPNRWQQGFAYGYIGDGGFFNNYVAIIVDGKAMIHNKVYKG